LPTQSGTGLKKYGKALDVEGAKEGKWLSSTTGDVIVHIFYTELRHYYNLDELWSNAPLVEIPDEYSGSTRSRELRIIWSAEARKPG